MKKVGDEVSSSGQDFGFFEFSERLILCYVWGLKGCFLFWLI